jgi:anaerobic magnesium-protoporphyrin IX monomethyl ester cyclase
MSVDVLFGQAYFFRFDPKLWSAQQPYAPLGALYAAAAVRQGGYEVALFDAMLAESEEEWTAALDAHRPRYAVLYEDNFNYLSKMCLSRMRQAAIAMIRSAAAAGVPVIVAGSDATDHPAIYLDAGADFVIVGEGEATLVELLDALHGRGVQPVEQVAGLCTRRDGIGCTRPREPMRDIDALARPAWDLVDVERYRSIWRQRHGYFSMNVATTRGCPYHCNWCAKPIYGQRYAARSPEAVADEIAWLGRTYRPDHLWIADDIFGLKPGWIERFAAALAARGAAMPFKCLMRADGVTPAVVAALGEARCRTVWLGAESGSQRVLDAMEKGTRVDQIAAAARMLRGAGIEVGFFLQFGYPGETLEDIARTLAMVRSCRPDDIGVSVSYPLPGTPFFERVRAQLGAKQNWVDSSDLALMYRGTYVAGFYRELHGLVHAEFRARRAVGAIARGRWREGIGGIVQGARLPWLRRRVKQLSRAEAPGEAPVLVPLLTREAASTPTDPAHSVVEVPVSATGRR